MADSRDYKVSVSGLDETGTSRSTRPATEPGRPYLSVHFACCSVYLRIYRNAEGSAYEGRCPKCGKSVRFLVGPHGTDQRVFVVR
jgi:hypothetical protein